jgi:predicted nucleic acid-binding protein
VILVLDPSAAVEIVLQRDSAQSLAEIVKEADWVIAPTLFIVEVNNVFWKYQKFVDYPYPDCERDIEQTIALPDQFINEMDLYREAFKLGCTLDHPIYDMLYVVLARRNSARLLTMDKKLIIAGHKAGVESGESCP